MEVKSAEDMIAAAKQISETYHCAVLCKGGHQLNDANDLLYRDGSYRWFNGKRIDNPNTHGTGGTLSSAIASNLVMTSIQRWNVRKLTSPERWQPCWTSDMDPDRWITDLIFAEKDLRRNRYDDDRTPFRGNKGDLGRL